jgi:rhodanese-related sulfurtransferase
MTTDASSPREDSRDPELITPAQAAVRVEGGALLIDVRPEKYLSSEGSTNVATWVDRYSMADQFLEGGANFLGSAVDPDREIVVMCGSVNGSEPMAKWLLENGHTNVSHVDGGFSAWRDAGLPTD